MLLYYCHYFPSILPKTLSVQFFYFDMLNATVDSYGRDYNIAASCDMMPLYSVCICISWQSDTSTRLHGVTELCIAFLGYSSVLHDYLEIHQASRKIALIVQ